MSCKIIMREHRAPVVAAVGVAVPMTRIIIAVESTLAAAGKAVARNEQSSTNGIDQVVAFRRLNEVDVDVGASIKWTSMLMSHPFSSTSSTG